MLSVASLGEVLSQELTVAKQKANGAAVARVCPIAFNDDVDDVGKWRMRGADVILEWPVCVALRW